MFSCLILKRQAPLDMMDEPQVWRDKSWTNDSDTHSSHNTAASPLKQQGHLVEQEGALLRSSRCNYSRCYPETKQFGCKNKSFIHENLTETLC